jgi:hybrid cluster-associated redox disulfide protein
VLLDASTPVDAVLRQAPGAAHVFIAHHTACIGCSLAQFCMLEDAARHYRLDLQQLIAELQAAGPLPYRILRNEPTPED